MSQYKVTRSPLDPWIRIMEIPIMSMTTREAIDAAEQLIDWARSMEELEKLKPIMYPGDFKWVYESLVRARSLLMGLTDPPKAD